MRRYGATEEAAVVMPCRHEAHRHALGVIKRLAVVPAGLKLLKDNLLVGGSSRNGDRQILIISRVAQIKSQRCESSSVQRLKSSQSKAHGLGVRLTSGSKQSGFSEGPASAK